MALLLFSKMDCLYATMGKASEFAELSQFEFQKEMAARDISISYEEEEFEKDFQTIMKKHKKD